jgi:DNA-nicking Smr family endonuclease
MSDWPDEISISDPLVVPIEDSLDLHTFHPKEVGDLIPEYLVACRERGILRVRIVHGKGQGFLRERVHGILRRTDGVAEFHLSEKEGGDWGSTTVTMTALPDAPYDGRP